MTPSEAPAAAQPWVLQFCHGYDGPFLDCARQYAALFQGTSYKVCTVYLTGEPSAAVERGSASDEVIFLGYDSKAVRGLKLGAMRRLREIVAGRDFRLCIAHRFKPIYIALLATRLPVIGVHHAFGVYSRPMRRWFINRFRSRLLLLGVSNAVRDEMRAQLPGWEAQRIETLYNRIDIAAVQAEQVSRAVAREALGLPQDAWVVGNVGRLHPDKDQATLIRGFAQALPQLPAGSLLAIMGSGRLEQSLRQLANELEVADRVRFLGQVPQGRRYFKAFDVFALSSDHEPFGMVLLEALAAGVPLIGTDCGGGREVVEGLGGLFPLGDAPALARELVARVRADRPELERRLRERFSDEAARAAFRALPLLRTWQVNG
ncbi:glycosyltransferase [Pseudomonas sp. GCM10022188]|uniref:glycosyltransferase n=1 Tax=Pseudomonas TaxID=286 RepID=UPI001E45DE17|nr:glycosyltransferase [Pseudomonas oryzagri]MCC6076397.1 glycosyltransferase [Pseudomonas oryzagri]